MLLPSSQTTGDLHLNGIRKVADVIYTLLLYLHSYKKLQEVENKRQNFYAYGHYKVIHEVPYQYLASFFAICSKKKVKFILEQATKAQRGSRGIALLFH